MKKFTITDAHRALVKIDQSELDARAILEAARAAKRETFRLVLCKILEANYHSALTVDYLAGMAKAELDFYFDHDAAAVRERIQTELTEMARAGFLRSRLSRGKRLYEVAY